MIPFVLSINCSWFVLTQCKLYLVHALLQAQPYVSIKPKAKHIASLQMILIYARIPFYATSPLLMHWYCTIESNYTSNIFVYSLHPINYLFLDLSYKINNSEIAFKNTLVISKDCPMCNGLIDLIRGRFSITYFFCYCSSL